MNTIADAAVAAKFEHYPVEVRKKLLRLRELIFETAEELDQVGPLLEVLKWGEPAYLTSQSGSGSTIRIDWKTKSPDQYAMYFNCKTSLLDTFRTIFPNEFTYEGNRALVFKLSESIPEDALRHCIGAALTYHCNRRTPLPSSGRPAPKHALNQDAMSNSGQAPKPGSLLAVVQQTTIEEGK